MSSQVVKYQPELYSDVNHTEPPQVALLSGTQNRRIETHTADSHTASQTSFRIRTADPKAVISRKMYMKFTVTVTAKHATGAGNEPNWTNFAPEPYCVQNAMSNIEFDYNGTKITQQVNSCFPAISAFNSSSQKRSYVGQPTMPNMCGSYTTLSGGTAWNPFKATFDGGYGVEPGRNSAAFFSASAEAAGYQTRTYTFIVPLWGPFMEFDSENPSGFSNLTQFNITINWSTQFKQMMFGYQDATIGQSTTISTAPNFTGTSPTLLYETYTAVNSIPASVLQYDGKMYDVHRKTVVAGNLATAGSHTDALSPLIGLSRIPEKIYVYFAQPDSDFDYTDPVGTFCDLTSLTLTFKNKEYNFTSAQMPLIALQSIRNGYDTSYGYANGTQLSGRGLVACFVMGKDIGLEPNEYPGSPSNSTLQVKASGLNRGVARQMDLYVVTETDMRLYLGDAGGSKLQYGLTDEEQRAAEGLPYSNVHESDLKVSGGGLKKHGKNLLKIGEQFLNHLSKQQKNIDNGLKYVDRMRAENAGGSVVAGGVQNVYQNRFP